jgi:predicted PurR-regulated permease PerM
VEASNPQPASRALFAAASLVVVVAGLQVAADILLPILFSVFLAVAAMPIFRGLLRLGVPNFVAIPMVVLALAGVLRLGPATLLESILNEGGRADGEINAEIRIGLPALAFKLEKAK